MPEERKRISRGLVQVYTGDGKGKTTAALGLAFRASGHGFKTYVIQFMKGQIVYGELRAAGKPDSLITIEQMGRPEFVNKRCPDPIDIKMASDALARAKEIIGGGRYDIVVLDEVNVAIDFGLINVSDVLELIKNKPAHVEMVLTGRNASPEIIKAADLVTEMKQVKHYFEQGVGSRTGIER